MGPAEDSAMLRAPSAAMTTENSEYMRALLHFDVISFKKEKVLGRGGQGEVFLAKFEVRDSDGKYYTFRCVAKKLIQTRELAEFEAFKKREDDLVAAAGRQREGIAIGELQVALSEEMQKELSNPGSGFFLQLEGESDAPAAPVVPHEFSAHAALTHQQQSSHEKRLLLFLGNYFEKGKLEEDPSVCYGLFPVCDLILSERLSVLQSLYRQVNTESQLPPVVRPVEADLFLLDLFKSMLLGIQALEEAGRFHGDIKPDNVGLRVSGGKADWCLFDLGSIGHATGYGIPGLDEVGGLRGTPLYMAPEVANNDVQNAHVNSTQRDIYATALTLFAVLGEDPAKVLGLSAAETKDPVRLIQYLSKVYNNYDTKAGNAFFDAIRADNVALCESYATSEKFRDKFICLLKLMCYPRPEGRPLVAELLTEVAELERCIKVQYGLDAAQPAFDLSSFLASLQVLSRPPRVHESTSHERSSTHSPRLFQEGGVPAAEDQPGAVPGIPDSGVR